MNAERDFTPDEVHVISVRAVNQLISDVEGGRLLQNKELAETIALCIRHTEPSQLRNLKWLLYQNELEGKPTWDASEKPKWQN